MTDNNQVQDLLARAKQLKASRGTWEKHWQELAEVLRTDRADFTATRTAGGSRTEQVFDSTPQQAARGLASALDGMLKGRQSQWFNIRAEDEDLNEIDEVKNWLRDVDRRLWRALFDDQAHFADRSFETDQDLVVFGTGILFTEEVPGRGLNFRAIHLRDALIAENSLGDIDTVFRYFSFSGRQAVQQFGLDRLGAKTREALRGGGQSKPDARFQFLHVVLPRVDLDPNHPGALGKPFASLWIDVDSEHLIGEGGYHEFPYAIPRWETVTGEVYGRSPGMLALADARTLNAMSRTNLDAGEKVANPPLLAASDGLTSNVRLFPGGINYIDYDSVPAGRRPLEPLITGANLPISLEMENQRRDMIWAAFFRNVLQLPINAPQMTATEILERKEEFLRVIGPTFGRLESGYIAPIVNRVFGLMKRAGAFAPPPDILRDRRITFAFDSPVSQARKQIEALAVRGALEQAAPFLELNPAAVDLINSEEAIRTIFAANGADGLLLGEDALERIRTAREVAQVVEVISDVVGGAE